MERATVELKQQRRAAGPRDAEQEAAWKSTPAERLRYIEARRKAAAERDGDRFRIAAELVAQAELAIERDAGLLELAPGALSGADPVVAAAQGIVERVGFENLPWAKKKANMAKYVLDEEMLQLGSPFMDLALSEPVVAAVSAYLGVVPVLNYVDVWCSRHRAEPAARSQLWHLDNADVHQVKLFLHCSDVDPGVGPLTVLDAAASERLSDAIGYTLAEGRVTDETVAEVVGQSALRPLTGPAGTAYFVDTSRCFHFGSRVSDPGRYRLVAIFQYLTPYAFTYGSAHTEEAPFRALAREGASERERLVLGAA